jgi:two-component system response regulator NreC
VNGISVLICDDHELFREGVKAILETEAGLTVVGEARNGRDAVAQAARAHPDVVLMDMEMPELNGLEATRRIHQADAKTKIILLTMYAEDDLVAACMEAGAAGYVLKDVPATQLVYAIKAVAKGGRYLSPGAMGGIVDRYLRGGKRVETRYDLLTDREREVLKLLADGLSVKDIGTRLSLSVKTVDVHKTNLMRKLGIHDRAGLIRYAIQHRLIRLPHMK